MSYAVLRAFVQVFVLEVLVLGFLRPARPALIFVAMVVPTLGTTTALGTFALGTLVHELAHEGST